MKNALLSTIVSFLLLWGPVSLPAATTAVDTTAGAVLSAVSGKVTLKNVKGKSRKGLVGSKVYQGETIKVAKASKADVTLFDGSVLELQSNTQLVLTTLKKHSEKEKNLKFQLSFGELVAKVKKLLTPTSSFEVEAGGAICGVRGTQYDISYDPATNKTTITVTEGSVYFTMGGNTYIVHAGESISFINGQPDKGAGQNPAGGTSSNNSNNNSNSNDNNGINGGIGSLGSIGSSPIGNGGALGDLNGQFIGGIITNGDNTNSDPAVNGSIKVNVSAGIPLLEAVP